MLPDLRKVLDCMEWLGTRALPQVSDKRVILVEVISNSVITEQSSRIRHCGRCTELYSLSCEGAYSFINTTCPIRTKKFLFLLTCPKYARACKF
jgi:hypothetical protein